MGSFARISESKYIALPHTNFAFMSFAFNFWPYVKDVAVTFWRLGFLSFQVEWLLTSTLGLWLTLVFTVIYLIEVAKSSQWWKGILHRRQEMVLRFRHSCSVVLSALARVHSERRWKDFSLFNLIKNNETTFSLQINIQFNESSLFKIYEVRVLSFR